MIRLDDGTIGFSPYDKLRNVAERVIPGMTRAHVERIFPNSNGGIMGDTITIYNEYPGLKVEVSYNRRGGSASAENVVLGPARVYWVYHP